MKKSTTALISLLFLLISTSLFSQDEASSDEFNLGISAYENGDYAGAVLKLSHILDDLKLSSIDKIIKAHSILGASYYFLDKEGHARGHFKTLLNFDPDFELPKDYFPPKVVALFEEVKGVKKLEETALETQGSNPSSAIVKSRSGIDFEESRGKDPNTQNSYFNNFIPFGWGQYYNNQSGKGAIFLVGETVALLSAITTASIFKGIQKSDGTFDNPSTGNGLKSAFYASIATFSALAITGIIDSLIYYRQFPYRTDDTKKISFKIISGNSTILGPTLIF
jgi:hypothetical protein